MGNEIKQDFLQELEKNLEKDLKNLEIENKKELAKHKEEIIKDVKNELIELERKNEEKLQGLEAKLKRLYFILLGTALILLIITIGMFFYLRNSFR